MAVTHAWYEKHVCVKLVMPSEQWKEAFLEEESSRGSYYRELF